MSSFYTSVHRAGNYILYRGYKDGEAISKKVKFSPSLFVPVKNPELASGWKTLIDSQDLQEFQFDTMYEASQFIKEYDEMGGIPVHGNTNYVVQYLWEEFPHEIKFDYDLIHIFDIDIEVDSNKGFIKPEDASAEVTAVTIRSSRTGKYHVFTHLPYSLEDSELDFKDEVIHHPCKNERDLLLEMLNFWVEDYPDVVTGWNIEGYDIPYLVNRIRRVLGEEAAKMLSPWGILKYSEIVKFGSPRDSFELLGIQVLDYLAIFTKFAQYPPQETYKLDHIAHVVLGDRKLSYEEHGNITDLLNNNPQKYIDYNIKDTALIHKMEKKIGIIRLCMTMAYKGAVNYTDTLGTVGIWDSILYRNLASKFIAVPPKDIPLTRDAYPGGYVKEVQKGMHNWVASFDLDSLYPNIIVEYNISPETLIRDSMSNVDVDSIVKESSLDRSGVDDSVIVAGNGAHFTNKRQGFIPGIVEQFYAQRKATKDSMNAKKKIFESDKSNKELESEIIVMNNEQMALKLLLNSLYGAMGNIYFRYYSLAMASAITLSGQLTIKWGEKAINSYLNNLLKSKKDYIIAIDTDSLYVNLEDVSSLLDKKFDKEGKIKLPFERKLDLIDRFCDERLNKVLRESYIALHNTMCTYKPRMNMKRENIADTGIWTAKKRYILNVWDSEGVRYSEPKLKIMGLEAVKSSTPEICRDKLKESFKIIMNSSEEETQEFIKEFKEEFRSSSPVQVGSPRGVNNIEKWIDGTSLYRSGCPIHVRASINYNNLLKEHSLLEKYSTISSGDKIKYVSLKMPNPSKTHVVGFTDTLPEEFNLHKYIDYDKQFEKTFIEPIKIILDSIGWHVEKQDTLDEFFS